MRLNAVVEEGKTLILIPDPGKALVDGRLEPAWMDVFYNPRMEFNRDLSVVALQAYIQLYAPHKPVTVVEPLSATGVRGLRYALEVEDVGLVILNDIDENAYNTIKANIRLNRAESKVKVYKRDASSLMYTLRSEEPTPVLVVDLDPYGSPAPFADAALALVGHHGLLAATATDVAVLEGSKPVKAYRRYLARLRKTPQSKEVAVRALLGYIARVAGMHDKAIRPLLSYYADHYVRVYVLIERGARKADRVLQENLGYMVYCRSTGYAYLSSEPETCPWTGDPGLIVGPLWIGELWDPQYISRVIVLLETKYSYIATRKRCLGLMRVIEAESEIQRVIHQSIPTIASKILPMLPKKAALIEELRSMGYSASPTHFNGMGIRTDSGYEELVEAMRRATPTQN